MKNSLAIAYAMKRKAKKMADGGSPSTEGETLGSRIGYPGADKKAPRMMAQGGQMDSGYLPMPEDEDEENEAADHEDEKDLNQHLAMGGDVVDRIMARRHNMTKMSEGGRVANSTEITADAMPAEYDDLVLRDDLESSSDGANNGDFIGNEQEDQDRADIVARVMRSRAKKDRLPSPR